MGLLDCLDWLHVGVCDNCRNGFYVSDALPSETFKDLVDIKTESLSWIWVFSILGLEMTFYRRAPTSGGQYHWVSEFAPRNSQRFISYIVGRRSLLPMLVGIL